MSRHPPTGKTQPRSWSRGTVAYPVTLNGYRAEIDVIDLRNIDGRISIVAWHGIALGTVERHVDGWHAYTHPDLDRTRSQHVGYHATEAKGDAVGLADDEATGLRWRIAIGSRPGQWLITNSDCVGLFDLWHLLSNKLIGLAANLYDAASLAARLDCCQT